MQVRADSKVEARRFRSLLSLLSPLPRMFALSDDPYADCRPRGSDGSDAEDAGRAEEGSDGGGGSDTARRKGSIIGARPRPAARPRPPPEVSLRGLAQAACCSRHQ